MAEAEAGLFKADGFEAGHHLGTEVPADQILEMVEAGAFDVALLVGAGSSRWLENLLLG